MKQSRMTSLVQDLLELSGLDNKQVKFNMKLINLVQLVAESVEQHQIHALKKRQIMTFHSNIEKVLLL